MGSIRPHLVLLKPQAPRNLGRKHLTVPALPDPCGCAVPVRCFTNGDGGVLQECLRCGERNVIERRPGIPTISKARAAELKMFGPGGRP